MTLHRRHIFRRALGFTLIELLIAMALIGILMASLSMVMGQVVQNNEILTGYLTTSSDMVSLRRLLHRDIQSISGDVEFHKDGFQFETTHNLLLDTPLPMVTRWRIRDGKVTRSEGDKLLSYNSTRVFMEGLQSWNLELFDYELNRWNSLVNLVLAEREVEIGALKITLTDENGQEIEIIERLPYARVKDEEE